MRSWPFSVCGAGRELHLAAAQEHEARDAFAAHHLEDVAAVQRELHVLRPDRELARDELRRRVEPQPIEALHEGQPVDRDDAPRIRVRRRAAGAHRSARSGRGPGRPFRSGSRR